MRCTFINAQRAKDNTARLCQLFGISRSGFYAWRSRPASRRAREDVVLLAHIQTEFEARHRSYGRPRMVEELRELGFRVGHTRIGRLMRENGIKAVRTRKFKRTTNSNHSYGFALNLLDQNFSASKPNDKWSVDISYIPTRQGWLYLAVVLDLHSRRIVGWSVSDRMKRDLALKALPQGSFEEKLEPALQFLANPWKLWQTGQITLQRTVLRLAFTERLAYHQIGGARTPKISLPFKALTSD